MKWLKKGVIFSTEHTDLDYVASHTQIPTAILLKDRIRIFFSSRPNHNQSIISWFDVSIEDPTKILDIAPKPVLSAGRGGMFDEHGVMPQSAIIVDNKLWLYYSGWSRREEIPYSNWTGLATSSDCGKHFKRAFHGPVMDRTPLEHFSATGVLVKQFNDQFIAWYASGVDWVSIDNKLEELYVIKSAQSNDGINWLRNGKQVVATPNNEQPTHRPAVIKLDDIYHMWFCFRGLKDFRDGQDAYRIGYAYSNDLVNWHRCDEKAGIDISDCGWDSKMMAYPNVLETPSGIYMFYNGNGFGQSGIGYAVLQK